VNLDTLKKEINQNRFLISFILKGLLFFTIWNTLVKFLVDKIYSDINALTVSYGAVMKVLYQWVGINGNYTIVNKSCLIWINEQAVVNIADPCNGFELFGLFIGFIWAFGGKKKRLLFLTLGSFSIYIINLIRMFALANVAQHHQELLDFHHHYTFTIFVYGYIIMLWWAWTKLNSKPANV